MAKQGLAWRILTAVLLVAVLSGCASTPPVQEMSDARQAVQAARHEVGPGDDRPALVRAQTLLDRAERLLAEGDYAEARRAAVAAKRLAEEARVQGR